MKSHATRRRLGRAIAANAGRRAHFEYADARGNGTLGTDEFYPRMKSANVCLVNSVNVVLCVFEADARAALRCIEVTCELARQRRQVDVRLGRFAIAPGGKVGASMGTPSSNTMSGRRISRHPGSRGGLALFEAVDELGHRAGTILRILRHHCPE